MGALGFKMSSQSAEEQNIPRPDQFYRHNNIDCSHCPVGHFCCTLKVRLSFRDRLRIFLHTRMRTKTYAERLLDDSGWGIKLVNGDCYFLKRTKEHSTSHDNGDHAYCTIYSARPKICRQFPHFYEDVSDCREIVKRWKRTTPMTPK